MTAAVQKALERRLAVLEQRTVMLMDALHLTDKEKEQMELDEALDHMAATGDPTLINQHLMKVNAKRISVQGGEDGKTFCNSDDSGDESAAFVGAGAFGNQS